MRKTIDMFLGKLDAVAEWVCRRLLEIIVAVTVLQVVLRFVFNSPTKWSEEVALLALVWFGMIAVAIGVRRHGHIAITYVRDRLPAVPAAFLDYGSQVLIFIFACVVGYNGILLTELAGAQVLSASGIPKWVLYFSSVVGGALAAINALGCIISGDVCEREETPADIASQGQEGATR